MAQLPVLGQASLLTWLPGHDLHMGGHTSFC